MSQVQFPSPPDHGRTQAFFRRHTNTIISHPVCAFFFGAFLACCLGAWFSGGEMFIMIPALILGGICASVAWWWAPGLSRWAKIGWIVVSAAPLFAEGAILHWHFQPAGISAKDSKAQVPARQAASLLFEWKWARLPTVMPASGTVSTMPIVAQIEFGGRALLLSPRPGSPGDKLTWGEDTRQYGGVYRCDVTNYSGFPIFNLVMTFRTEFFRPEKDGSLHQGEPVVETQDRPVVIDKLDSKETFSFYAYSSSRMYAEVSLPKKVTYLRGDRDQRETAHLLPQADQLITLFPMTLIAAKSPPTPPPPAPSQLNRLEKK
jgi:hypothetical protein